MRNFWTETFCRCSVPPTTFGDTRWTFHRWNFTRFHEKRWRNTKWFRAISMSSRRRPPWWISRARWAQPMAEGVIRKPTVGWIREIVERVETRARPAGSDSSIPDFILFFLSFFLFVFIFLIKCLINHPIVTPLAGHMAVSCSLANYNLCNFMQEIHDRFDRQRN